jgi:hypothetical protein
VSVVRRFLGLLAERLVADDRLSTTAAPLRQAVGQERIP